MSWFFIRLGIFSAKFFLSHFDTSILFFVFFKAEPALDEDGNPVAKKGRGRPPGKNLIKIIIMMNTFHHGD